MCIWDSYVYQKGDLCFLIHKSYVRSIKSYCFLRNYAAIPVQLEIIIIIIIIIVLLCLGINVAVQKFLKALYVDGQLRSRPRHRELAVATPDESLSMV